jgi:hypothetical protein
MPDATPLPVLTLWRGDGCHLCDRAAALLDALLDERRLVGLAVPTVLPRRIAEDPAVERQLFELIPVLEFGGERLPLALDREVVRVWLERRLDDPG